MRVKPARFSVGDWVYVYCPRRYQGKNPKWTKWYSKPMLITKILGPVNVLVQKGPRAKGQVIHLDKLKRCEGSTPRSWLVAEPAEERPAAAVPPVVQSEEAPLSVPENDEMSPEEGAAAGSRFWSDAVGPWRIYTEDRSNGRGGAASSTRTTEEERGSATAVPAARTGGGAWREDVFRMHSLRCC